MCVESEELRDRIYYLNLKLAEINRRQLEIYQSINEAQRCIAESQRIDDELSVCVECGALGGRHINGCLLKINYS